ncbi:MAG: Gmad2 immunoglobulin-like domain-containing protein [Gaiellaceae bacterium]
MKALLLVPLVLILAACGGKNSSYQTSPPTTAPTTTTAPAQATTFRVYLVDPGDGKLSVAARTVPATQAVASAALTALAAAPDTTVPPKLTVKIANGEATVAGADLSGAALAQVVYTLTQFPTIKSVNGKTRSDVEEFVPAILVEQPLPDDTVSSPLHVTGNANTFEATFQYKLLDAAGTVLAKHFVTATSGSGTRGTFDFTIPFTIGSAQAGTLVVYESSAADGSVIHERRIALRLTP